MNRFYGISVNWEKVIDTQQLAFEAVQALSEVKGKEIRLLDLTEVASFADFFVLATGDSHVHMRALADRVRKAMTKRGKHIGHSEGRESKSWILLDYETLIIHILSRRAREYYALEQLWGDAKVIRWDENHTFAGDTREKEVGLWV